MASWAEDGVDATAAREFDACYERARDRLAVQLAALTGDPHEAVDEVAEWLGAPIGTVKSWLHRGRRALAAALEPHPKEVVR